MASVRIFDAPKYYKEKYWNDPVYRRWRINASSRWAKNNQETVNTNQRNLYANRTPQQIKKRERQLKKMRAIGRWKK